MLTYGNGRTLTKTYDQDYMIDSVASSASDGLKLDFGRDVMANITSASGTLGANPPDRQYVYDTLYRLTRVNDTSGAMLEDYNYNKTGDRTLKQFAGQAAQVYTYLSGTHRLGSVDGVSRSYDSNGNTTNRGDSITLAYNDQNRLYAAAIPANWTEYGYSGRGERVRKLQDNVGIPIADRYAYNESGQMLHNRKNETIAGSPVETQLDYLFIDAIPVAQTREKTLTYIETDHLGTPRVAANSATNANEWSWDLLGKAFGDNAATTAPGGNDVQLRYPGQWADAETGLNYNYFRNYESAIGRYVESDPISLSGGINTYAYVAQNPMSLIDRFGLAYGLIDCAPDQRYAYRPIGTPGLQNWQKTCSPRPPPPPSCSYGNRDDCEQRCEEAANRCQWKATGVGTGAAVASILLAFVPEPTTATKWCAAGAASVAAGAQMSAQLCNQTVVECKRKCKDVNFCDK